MPCEETKKFQYEATKSFSGSQDISTISSSHYSNRKAAGHFSMVRFKEECPPHRTDCLLERKSGGDTWAEKKTIWDTAYRLHGKGLDTPYYSYWGWLLWFFGHSVITFLSKIGITSRSLKVASNCLQTPAQNASNWIWSKAKSLPHERNACGTTIPCHYVTSRNGYCKRTISTTKSKRVFKKSQTALKMKMNVLCNLCF